MPSFCTRVAFAAGMPAGEVDEAGVAARELLQQLVLGRPSSGASFAAAPARP